MTMKSTGRRRGRGDRARPAAGGQGAGREADPMTLPKMFDCKHGVCVEHLRKYEAVQALLEVGVDGWAVRAWLREARRRLRAAARAGVPVGDGVSLRLVEERRPVRMSWRLVAVELLGEDMSREAWSRIKKRLLDQPRFREVERLDFKQPGGVNDDRLTCKAFRRLVPAR